MRAQLAPLWEPKPPSFRSLCSPGAPHPEPPGSLSVSPSNLHPVLREAGQQCGVGECHAKPLHLGLVPTAMSEWALPAGPDAGGVGTHQRRASIWKLPDLSRSRLRGVQTQGTGLGWRD